MFQLRIVIRTTTATMSSFDLIVLFTIIDCTILTMSLVGNSLVIIAIIRDATSANFFIISISVADMISSLVAIPFCVYILVDIQIVG